MGLQISRKIGESIVIQIGGIEFKIEVRSSGKRGGDVELHFPDAPDTVRIIRSELKNKPKPIVVDYQCQKCQASVRVKGKKITDCPYCGGELGQPIKKGKNTKC